MNLLENKTRKNESLTKYTVCEKIAGLSKIIIKKIMLNVVVSCMLIATVEYSFNLRMMKWMEPDRCEVTASVFCIQTTKYKNVFYQSKYECAEKIVR